MCIRFVLDLVPQNRAFIANDLNKKLLLDSLIYDFALKIQQKVPCEQNSTFTTSEGPAGQVRAGKRLQRGVGISADSTPR